MPNKVMTSIYLTLAQKRALHKRAKQAQTTVSQEIRTALDKHLEQGREQAEAELTEKEIGCLKRAWHRFTQRLNVLTFVLGQMMQIRLSDAKLIWIQLRRLGNLKVILGLLGRKFKTSLLGDYRCLKPWPPRIPES